MRRWFTCAALIGAAWLGITAAAPTRSPKPDSTPTKASKPDRSDDRAIDLAIQVMDALGGKMEWGAIRGVRWISGAESKGRSIGVPRRHSWDRWQGWHRMQGVLPDGRAYVIVDNVIDGRARAWIAGAAVEGDSLLPLVARAREAWREDSFWLLMPYRLQEPGVILSSAGDTTVAGVEYDRIEMTFGPDMDRAGDRCWIYVNRALHQIQALQMLPKGASGPPRGYTFEGWTQVAHLLFPTAHRDTMFAETLPGDTLRTNIYTRAVQTLEAFPPREFTAP